MDAHLSGAIMQEILDRLMRIESVLNTLVELRTVKEFYSTAEVGAILSKAEFTVREWCRHTDAVQKNAAVEEADTSPGLFPGRSYSESSEKDYCRRKIDRIVLGSVCRQ